MSCIVRASHNDEPSLCPTCMVAFLHWLLSEYGEIPAVDPAQPYDPRLLEHMEARVREFVKYRRGVAFRGR